MAAKRDDRIIDLSDLGKRPAGRPVVLPDGEHRMLTADSLDPVLIAKVEAIVAKYNDEGGSAIARAARQDEAVREMVRLALPTMADGFEAQIPFLDCVRVMSAFLADFQAAVEAVNLPQLTAAPVADG